MTDEKQIPKTRFIATNDVEKLTPRRPYVAERFYLQMKNGPDLVLVRDVDYEATEKERDHWKARAERAEAEAAALKSRVAELEAQLAAARAAQQWRPVTEPPTEDDTVCLVWSHVWDVDFASWYEGAFHYRYMTPPTHWRPLPVAPDAEAQP